LVHVFPDAIHKVLGTPQESPPDAVQARLGKIFIDGLWVVYGGRWVSVCGVLSWRQVVISINGVFHVGHVALWI
jgi:hypothetical protein